MNAYGSRGTVLGLKAIIHQNRRPCRLRSFCISIVFLQFRSRLVGQLSIDDSVEADARDSFGPPRSIEKSELLE